uniref:Predicted gene 15155 n=2 Tax=Mus musculus TaxID=10090 RepID=B1B034_MOUSE
MWSYESKNSERDSHIKENEKLYFSRGSLNTALSFLVAEKKRTKHVTVNKHGACQIAWSPSLKRADSPEDEVLLLLRNSSPEVSLCTLSCLGTHSVDETGVELRDMLAFASTVLRLKCVCVYTPLRKTKTTKKKEVKKN